MSYLKISKTEEIDQIVKKYLYEESPLKESQKLQEPAIKWQPSVAIKKRNEKRDTLFGIRSNNQGLLFIGKSPILITEGNSINGSDPRSPLNSNRRSPLNSHSIITIEDINYNLTPGLLVLITKFNPDKEVYDEDDLENYKRILIQTKAIYSNSEFSR